MLAYFYPSQGACNEREVRCTQGSLPLFAMHVCSPPFTLAQFSSPLQMCQHHQVYNTLCMCVSFSQTFYQRISSLFTMPLDSSNDAKLDDSSGMLVFINLSLVLIATYYKHISPDITLLGCHP